MLRCFRYWYLHVSFWFILVSLIITQKALSHFHFRPLRATSARILKMLFLPPTSCSKNRRRICFLRRRSRTLSKKLLKAFEFSELSFEALSITCRGYKLCFSSRIRVCSSICYKDTTPATWLIRTYSSSFMLYSEALHCQQINSRIQFQENFPIKSEKLNFYYNRI